MTVEGRLDAGNGHAGRLKSNKRGPADLRWPFAVHPHGCGENAWHDSAAIAGITTFSILCRIVWIVTRLRPHDALRRHNFQYPVSDRLDCNVRGLALGCYPHRLFQYPVSDRLDCNLVSLPSDRQGCYQLSVSCVGSSGL